MKFLFATALAACASAQTTLGNNFFGYGNNLGYGYGNTLGYGFGNTLGYAAAPVATTAAAPATTTVAAPAVATNFGYGNTLGYGNTFGYGNTLGWNYGNTLGATTTTPLYTRAATTATTVAAPAATTVAAATNYAFGNTLGNFGGYSFPYYGGYGGWAAPVVQTCEAKAQSVWNLQSGDFATEAKKLYDGRSVSWVQYPKPLKVTNKAEYEAAIDNWALVGAWKGKTHNARRIGNEVHFETDWSGTKSNINGHVIPAGTPSTYHIYNCGTNSEVVYADYGGVLVAMGAGGQ